MTFARLKNWLAALRERRLRARIWREAMTLAKHDEGNVHWAIKQVVEARHHLKMLDVTTMQVSSESTDK